MTTTLEERIIFAEESVPNRHIKLVMVGDVDETLLDALAAFIARRRKRHAEMTWPQFPDEGEGSATR